MYDLIRIPLCYHIFYIGTPSLLSAPARVYIYIYIYTSVNPCIYMHGVKWSRVKRYMAFDQPVSV